MKRRTSLVFSDTFTMGKMRSETILTTTLQNNRFLCAFRLLIFIAKNNKSLGKAVMLISDVNCN
jgi:hypothetical protein